MSYDKANIFVGKYNIPKDGHIKLNKVKIKIKMGVELSDGLGVIDSFKKTDDKFDPWLIIEDGNFWPVMIKLGEEDLDSIYDFFVRESSVK
jgi:hypothetical protein